MHAAPPATMRARFATFYHALPPVDGYFGVTSRIGTRRFPLPLKIVGAEAVGKRKTLAHQ